MASGGAVALLLRTAALGGLTAAAWLLGGPTASASADEAPPAVEITTEAPALVDDPAGWVTTFAEDLVDRHEPAKLVPPPVVIPPPVVVTPEDEPEPQDEGPVLDFTGGAKGTTRSGSVSNQAPPEVIQVKAQVRAARKAAKLAAELPPPPPPPAPPVVVAKQVVPLLPDLLPPPAPAKTEPAPVSDLTWTIPGPDAPLPTPQQAPVVATSSAASGHTDNSGGTRGVLAVLTSHNSLFPSTTWSVEERRDGTAPGSIPGLPATSPD
ncbi:hypothetical protein [Lentzea sp.]|uniref:hypothetical protein n=1 Tax=Lentzea sp. TaxID=56099 RepID=UPI002C861EC9|nr:hypothetical protein [Lentzea sp.]HUQ57444.1 hypothetical protein [Lentzea sp.]